MGYLVVFVLDNPDRCQDVLNAWENVGAKGITILESTGIGRIRQAGIRDDIPLMPSLSDLFRSAETHNRTLFSVVDDLELGRDLVEIAQSVVGDFSKPNTGLIFIAPLVEIYGLNKEDRR